MCSSSSYWLNDCKQIASCLTFSSEGVFQLAQQWCLCPSKRIHVVSLCMIPSTAWYESPRCSFVVLVGWWHLLRVNKWCSWEGCNKHSDVICYMVYEQYILMTFIWVVVELHENTRHHIWAQYLCNRRFRFNVLICHDHGSTDWILFGINLDCNYVLAQLICSVTMPCTINFLLNLLGQLLFVFNPLNHSKKKGVFHYDKPSAVTCHYY